VVLVTPRDAITDGGDRIFRALKVVQAKSHISLTLEHKRLSKHAEISACGLLVAPIGPVVSSGELSGYVLFPVGKTSVTRDIAFRNKSMLRKVVLALQGLHTHTIEGPIIHGDARIANLIVPHETDSPLFWIDLGSSQWNLSNTWSISDLFAHDMFTLIKSLLRGEIETLSKLRQCVYDYAEAPASEETIQELVDEIFNLKNAIPLVEE